MSRIGKMPITIPNGVTVDVVNGGDYGHQQITITGPKGTLVQAIRPGVTASVVDGVLVLERANETKQIKSNHGLYRSLLQNMVEGVSNGYKKELQLVGIGYRAEMQGNKVVFSLGYAHKIELVPPTGISISVQDQTEVTVEGIDKQQVGEIAAKIRGYRKPEPYKGKGVRYKGEHVRRKSIKKA